MNCILSLKCWEHGFESHSRHGCLCALILFVLFCVSAVALRQDDPLSKGSYWLCIGLRNWKSGQGSTKDCTAISGILNWVCALHTEPSSHVHIFDLCCISCIVTSVLPDPAVRIIHLLAIMFPLHRVSKCWKINISAQFKGKHNAVLNLMPIIITSIMLRGLKRCKDYFFHVLYKY
jgi:hypothetical protein